MTPRSGESPSRFPSSDPPCTVIRSTVTGAAPATGAGMFKAGFAGAPCAPADADVAAVSRARTARDTRCKRCDMTISGVN